METQCVIRSLDKKKKKELTVKVSQLSYLWNKLLFIKKKDTFLHQFQKLIDLQTKWLS